MLRGWIASGVEPGRFHVVKPSTSGLPLGVHHYRSAAEVGAQFDTVMLGIKPQKLRALAGQVSGLLLPGGTLISLLGGTRSASLQRLFTGAHVIRLMPNLAVEIGKSPLGLWSGMATPSDRSAINTWLSPLGRPVWLSAEDQMDALTALAGSGPAFIYRIIDAMAQAGARLGLDPEQSARLALTMTEGAAALAAASSVAADPQTPAQLAARVAAPGGMTQAGLDILDNNDMLLQLITATLSATAQRGAELAQLTNEDMA